MLSMASITPKPSTINDSMVLSEDEDSIVSIDKLLGQSKHDIERGKSFNSEISATSAMEFIYDVPSGVDEEVTDINAALGKGNDDFDFRTLNNEEFKTLIRGEPTKETFSNIGNMMKFMYPELSQRDRAEKQQAALNLKKSLVS